MEAHNSKLLLSPAKKANSAFKVKYPFPIVTSNCSYGQTDPNWKCMEGSLQEDCVLVHDEESIKLLYTQGFFGKGTLSKNAPKICLKNEDEECEKIQSESQSPKLEDDVIEVLDDDDEAPPAKISKTEEDVEVVLSDSSTSNFASETLQKRKKDSLKQNTSAEKESLQLTFEEAYFLSYGLGCLVVKDNRNQPLDLARLWNKFCDSTQDGNFPVMYTAYHHFRSKGYVVKTGLKYGTDYVLYKDGPPFYHATYSVIVKSVKEMNLRELKNNRQMTWASLLALNRLNSSTSKGLLFLYVIKPTAISENKISTPFCISQYKVEEVLFQRWVAAENREDDE